MRTLLTERLQLAPFTLGDVEAAHEWFADPVVMRFMASGPDDSVDATRERVERYRRHQAEHGFSKWLIRERATGEAIGDSGLLVLPETGIDLGFRFARVAWGRGLATEVAAAWTRAAFRDLGLDRLTAFAHRDNVASIRVLRKVGFSPTGERSVMGLDALTFALDASTWRERE